MRKKSPRERALFSRKRNKWQRIEVKYKAEHVASHLQKFQQLPKKLVCQTNSRLDIFFLWHERTFSTMLNTSTSHRQELTEMSMIPHLRIEHWYFDRRLITLLDFTELNNKESWAIMNFEKIGACYLSSYYGRTDRRSENTFFSNNCKFQLSKPSHHLAKRDSYVVTFLMTT
jgi:hypothetical protein